MKNLLHKPEPPAKPPTPQPVDVLKHKYTTPAAPQVRSRREIARPAHHHDPVPRTKKEYVLFLPYLLFSLVGYAGVAMIFLYIEPSNIKNFIFPNSYLPLLLISFLAHWLLFGYLFLHLRRGLLLALLLTILLTFQLQRVLTPITFVVPAIVAIVLELFLTQRQSRR